MKGYLFSDFDGTLSRGLSSMEFMKFLHARNLHSREAYKKQTELLENYRKNTLLYNDWLPLWARFWAKGLTGQKEKEILDAAKEFYKDFRKNIYSSSYEVMKILKDRNYHLTLVSVGAHEIIELASKDLGMDNTIATKIEIKNGLYADKITTRLHSLEGKAGALKQCRLSWFKELIAMGDSAHDISMLEKATYPIALNPAEELKQIARRRGWQICTHKNIINYIKDL